MERRISGVGPTSLSFALLEWVVGVTYRLLKPFISYRLAMSCLSYIYYPRVIS